ncbi:hypothetical protein JHK82_049824 [Glycine max]|nr:hypothetical protein JHK87_049500 [Glycine soja]KAG4935527.1 hypothetical protein JHK85_050446 [Glycine max]KAG5091046.1 hypothetical protein JHK82_049824 [Glycine max]KAG5094146.1 hypothetical protein JHK84_049734 [Glycine max]
MRKEYSLVTGATKNHIVLWDLRPTTSHGTKGLSLSPHGCTNWVKCLYDNGCRDNASEVAIILLPSNITVFALDFSGSGISGGEHVTLGWNEKDDLKVVVNDLRDDVNVSLIGLWSHSMGAVTSLMYGVEDPSIAGMVLDNPFFDLVDLMMELVKFAIQYMRRVIQQTTKFDIMDLNSIKDDDDDNTVLHIAAETAKMIRENLD